jgi:DNA mismatch endonuclease, patch repair protein
MASGESGARIRAVARGAIRGPRARRDHLSPSQRSAHMALIKQRDSRAELTLRRALFREGLRFRVADRRLTGTPDVTFVRARVAVFVDSAFWHGKLRPERMGRLPKWWQVKLTRNAARDVRVSRKLRREGWKVIRFSEEAVLSDVRAAASRVVRELAGTYAPARASIASNTLAKRSR